MSNKAFIDLDKLLYDEVVEKIFLSIGSFFICAGVILLLFDYDNCYCYCKPYY